MGMFIMCDAKERGKEDTVEENEREVLARMGLVRASV